MAKNGRVLAVLVGLSGPGEAWHWRGCGSPHLKRWMQQGPRPSAKPSKRWRQLASLWTGGAFGDFLSFWLLKCNPKIDSLGKKNQNASRWSKKSWFTPHPKKKKSFMRDELSSYAIVVDLKVYQGISSERPWLPLMRLSGSHWMNSSCNFPLNLGFCRKAMILILLLWELLI